MTSARLLLTSARLLLTAALMLAVGCIAEVDPCEDAGDDTLATCLQPTQTMEYYAQQSSGYFDTMDTAADRDIEPPYSELVARWEWPPWLKLTAFGYDNILSADRLLRLYPSTIPERECRGFDTHPFGRCYVVFYYEDEEHEGRGCPIYEEFTFNDEGEITWIEAWSDLTEFLPMADPEDRWAEGESVRLSSRVPGLGNASGLIDLDGGAMADAMAADRDVLDFVERANDWAATWGAEVEAAGDDLWPRGCGW
jgi:hypothetical protein